jgi:hypothetical protein
MYRVPFCTVLLAKRPETITTRASSGFAVKTSTIESPTKDLSDPSALTSPPHPPPKREPVLTCNAPTARRCRPRRAGRRSYLARVRS